MSESVKWGLLFSLECRLADALQFVAKRPKVWLDSNDAVDLLSDLADLVAACDWFLSEVYDNSGLKYVNIQYFRRHLDELKEYLK